MTQQAWWWQHHLLRPPPMTSGSRWAVARYPWGVAVWEKPLHWAAPAGMRVVDVVVTDPDAPIELAQAHALERMPEQSLARRTASTVPFPATPRSVTAAAVAGLVTLVVAAMAGGDWLLLAVLPVVAVVLALADRVPPHHHPAAWRRQGHEAASVPFTARIQLADALCQRSFGQPYAGSLRQAVRAALWACRADHPAGPGHRARLDQWLDDLDDGDRVAAAVLAQATSVASRSDAGQGPTTVVDRAVAVLPELVASLATPSAEDRAAILQRLQALRDACAEAVAARAALTRTVEETAARDLAPAWRTPDQQWVTTRVEDLLADLRSEAAVLREVDDELRATDDTRER